MFDIYGNMIIFEHLCIDSVAKYKAAQNHVFEKRQHGRKHIILNTTLAKAFHYNRFLDRGINMNVSGQRKREKENGLKHPAFHRHTFRYPQ
jgi:hypothetical protein